MTNSDQINNIGGTLEGAKTISEMEVTIPPGSQDLQELMQSVVSSIEWSFSDKSNVESSTKYPGSADVVYMGAGSFSVNPLLGRFIFGTRGNEPSSPLMKLDNQESTFSSSAKSTTLGSKNIDTKDGSNLNQVGAKYPSTYFTPQKTWVENLFPSFNGDLIKLSLLEGIQLLILRALKSTSSEQIIKQDTKDLGTIIVDNQEIEDKILARARS